MTVSITTSKPFWLSSPSGWQITHSGQYEFGGLLLGFGTRFIVTEVTGLLGGTSSGGGTRITSGPGNLPALITEDPRTIQMTIETDATIDEADDLIEQLQTAFQPPERWENLYADDNSVRGLPISQQSVLAYMRRGWSEPRIIFCRRTKINIVSNYDTATGRITCTVELQADNPLKYSMTTTQVDVHLDSGDHSAEFEWVNNGNYINGFPPYVKIRCPGPHGYRNLQLYRKWSNAFVSGGFSFDRLQSSFAWNQNWDVDFKQRITTPVGPLGHMTLLGWFRLKPGQQWLGITRDATYSHNGPIDVQFFLRDVWS